MSSTVKVSNDYFSSEFLLGFPEPGQHNVRIVCKVVDCNGIDWDIDCSADVAVKAFREKKHSTLMKSST